MEEIVISGISGRFPECNNIDELKNKLFAGIDMVTADDRRWPEGVFGLPPRSGKLMDLKHFDANFFGVHSKLANVMDPQLRLLLETTFEAILDAGVNPVELRGTKTGVFIGALESETVEALKYSSGRNSYCLFGGCRSMFSNRISYTFDFKGPSFTVNTACSSSLVALQRGVNAIRSGECEAAIIGGSNLCVSPNTSALYLGLHMLNAEGKCKAFDASGAGYVRSETVGVIFIQKATVARRVYATILGAKTNSDGYKEEGISYPSGKMQSILAQEVLSSSKIKPQDVAYVEAHGTGTKAGDPPEVNGIASVFCTNRTEPLLIGSVKSNLGHAEAASGICSIAKVIIAMESGVIPGNLHFKTPNANIPALSDGRLKVVAENQPWEGGLVAVNSFGFGGANAHALLRSNSKPKTVQETESILRLVTVSGCTEEAVAHLLENVEKYKNDVEFLALLDKIHSKNITGHRYRGYSILGNGVKEITPAGDHRRPIWFVYSGAGSQNPGICKQLMRIGSFKRSITKMIDCLKPYGIDILEILEDNSEKSMDNVVNMFVSVAAVQIALTDVLNDFGIEPDGIIGHSVGELGCGYADGALTAEQTLRSAYARGRVLLDAITNPGAMAAVKLSWEECMQRCPLGVFPACHNTSNNVTLAGPPETLDEFIKDLTLENVAAKRLIRVMYGFHSMYIASAAPEYRKELSEIIPNPMRRTTKWISSSFPEAEWEDPIAQFCSPDYHIKNFLSPVLFYEALQHVPKNAIVIEISPRCLLRAIIKEARGPTTFYSGLLRNCESDSVNNFLCNIGRLYNAGAQPIVSQLYPPILFPVGRGTQMISSLVEWDHSAVWDVVNFSKIKFGEEEIVISLQAEEHKYLAGHVIDGRVLFPASGYLVYIWKTFAKLRHQDFEKTAVTIDNLRIHRALFLPSDGSIKLSINILRSSGEFEISEAGSVVASGIISVSDTVEHLGQPSLTYPDADTSSLTSDDVYKELRLRGYEYEGLFQGITHSEEAETKGTLTWSRNWITFVDAMIQFSLLGMTTRDLYLPTTIQGITIDPTQQVQNSPITIHACRNTGILKSGGIAIRGIKYNLAPRRHTQSAPKLESYGFVPLHQATPTEQKTALAITSQIALENNGGTHMLKIVEISNGTTCLAPVLKGIVESEPSVVVDYTVIESIELNKDDLETIGVKTAKQSEMNDQDAKANLVVLSSSAEDNLQNAVAMLKPNFGFLLLVQDPANPTHTPDLEVVTTIDSTETSFVLLRKTPQTSGNPEVIHVSDTDFAWMDQLKIAMNGTSKVYLASQEPTNGLVGLVNCLRQEAGGDRIRAYFLQSKTCEPFSLSSPYYLSQIKKDLIQNVLSETNVWGTYRHLPLENSGDAGYLVTQHAYMNTLVRGDLSSFRWVQSPLAEYKLTEDKELCSVYYAPLNFRDVMVATGKLPPDALPANLATQDCIMGLEFSGRDSNGRRVFGMVPALGLATTCVADSELVWEVPESWSLEEAATIPVVYGTSYYALVVRGQLQPGESVLIHAGAGGVGQAAISIALHMACTVFTTVGSESKREFLKKAFPSIDDSHIGNSRDTSFEQMVMTQTKGRGVDLVLNSLAGEQLQASVRCLAEGGRFLELGKVDLANNSSLGMSIFLRNTSFHGILLESVLGGSKAAKQQVASLIANGIQDGAVKPLPRRVYQENEVEQAFRYMASGKHVGKILVQIRKENDTVPVRVPAIQRAYMDSNKSYVLIGGLGGFGLELADWLISRGARNFLLTSRNGIKTGYQELRVERWRNRHIRVIISTAKCSNKNEAETLLEQASSLGPVGGIFNLAVVLRDSTFENQTEDLFRTALEPKANTTKSLDAASRKLAPHLDYFVAFSSVACGRGNAGQSNYAFANSTMERICELRRAQRLPGLAIQWGAIGDVGLLAQKENTVLVGGTLPQRISSCLNVLDSLLLQAIPVVSCMVLAEKRTHVKDHSQNNVSQAVGRILHIDDTSAVIKTATLAELGMDSLMAAEIKQTLERTCDVFLTAKEVRELTFGKLDELTVC